MAERSNAQLSTAVQKLNDKSDVNLVDVLSLAELSIENLQVILNSIDSSIYREFLDIAEHISNAKTDISKLKINNINSERIPVAGHELHAVVEATEHATHQIMECAETIMTADPSNPGTYHNIVNDNIMTIFEACSFQDITGQRISKVVETLEYIEKRVSHFSKALGSHPVGEELDEEEKAKEARKQDQILHGPQFDGEGVSQDDIDSLFD